MHSFYNAAELCHTVLMACGETQSRDVPVLKLKAIILSWTPTKNKAGESDGETFPIHCLNGG